MIGHFSPLRQTSHLYSPTTDSRSTSLRFQGQNHYEVLSSARITLKQAFDRVMLASKGYLSGSEKKQIYKAQKDAARQIPDLAQKDQLPAFFTAISPDKDVSVRATAAGQIHELAKEFRLPAILAVMSASDPDRYSVQNSAACQLRSLPTPAARKIGFSAVWESDNYFAHNNAARIIGGLDNPKEQKTIFHSALESSNHSAKIAVVANINSLAESIRTWAFEEAWATGDSEIRKLAAGQIGSLPNADRVPAFNKAMASGDEAIQAVAALQILPEGPERTTAAYKAIGTHKSAVLQAVTYRLYQLPVGDQVPVFTALWNTGDPKAQKLAMPQIRYLSSVNRPSILQLVAQSENPDIKALVDAEAATIAQREKP
jgi:hypothetical protein